MIVLQTNHGDITIALNHEKAPISAANFEQYVRDGFYDGTLFHRVIDGFMVQGGGFDKEFNQKPTRSGKSLQGWGYAVFGEVVDGMDVVNEIKNVATSRRGMHADVPSEDVIIERAYVKDAE